MTQEELEYLTGQKLYEMMDEAFQEVGMSLDSFDECTSTEQLAWDNLACKLRGTR